jgi:hypothetical protein
VHNKLHTFYKKIVSEGFAKKKSTGEKQNRLFPGFILSRFWAFLGEGSSKTRYKNLTGPGTFLASPGTFLAPEETNHVGARPFLF